MKFSWILCLALGLAGLGCGDDDGSMPTPGTGLFGAVGSTGDAGAAGPGPSMCPGVSGTFGNPACESCIAGSCCSSFSACANQPECGALWACAGACGDDACVDACIQSHSSGASVLGSLIDCASASCGTQCGG